MVKSCCVRYCNFNKLKLKEKLSLHYFPSTNKTLLNEWLQFLDYGIDWKPSKYTAICSLHFKPSDFRLNTNLPRLLPSAVPTIKVISSNSNFCINDQSTVAESETEISHEELITVDEDLNSDIENTCGFCGKVFKFSLRKINDGDKFWNSKLFGSLNSFMNINKYLISHVCSYCENRINELEFFLLQIENIQIRLSNQYNQIGKNKKNDEPEVFAVENINNNSIPIQNPPNQIFINETTPNPPIIINNTNVIPQQTLLISLNDYIPQNGHYLPNMSIAPASKIELQTAQNFNIMKQTTPEINTNKTQLAETSNKKIKILQDIKIEPQQILVNLMPDKSLLKNFSELTKAQDMKIPNKTTNRNMDLKTMSLLSNSVSICKFCEERFVSKYALNHHVKFLCVSASDNRKDVKLVTKNRRSILRQTLLKESGRKKM